MSLGISNSLSLGISTDSLSLGIFVSLGILELGILELGIGNWELINYPPIVILSEARVERSSDPEMPGPNRDHHLKDRRSNMRARPLVER